MEQDSTANGRVVKAPPLMASSSRAKASSVAEPEPSQQQRDDVEMTERANTPSTIDGGEDPIDVDQPETTSAERNGVLKSPKSPKSPKLGTMADSTSNMGAGEEEEVPSDPNLLASYPIYLNTSLPSTSSLHLLQYPTYPRRAPLPLPVTAAERGIKQAIRWRPRAGWVQVELPLDMRAGVYTEEKATELGRGAAIKGGEIGIKSDIKPEPTSSDEDDGWGGTNKKSKHGSSSSRKGKGKARDTDEGTAQMPKKLEKIRLESDVMPNLTTYCVGVMKGSE
jgi:DNA-directed RNA polymerase III subunit RPC5